MSEEGPMKLQDAMAKLIDLCLQVTDNEGSLLSPGNNAAKTRIKRFQLIFNQKKDGPNNLKQHLNLVYTKCKEKILNLKADLDEMKDFLKWFADAEISLRPRQDDKSVSIPLSMVCRSCIKISNENEEKENIHELFLLFLLRVFAFVSTDDEEKHIDELILFLEELLDLEHEECPDLTSFFFHLMDKVTKKFGGKDSAQQIRKLLKGQIKREDRLKYEETIMNVAERFIGKMPKSEDGTLNPGGMPFDLSKMQNVMSDLTQEMTKNGELPPGILEAMNATSSHQ